LYKYDWDNATDENILKKLTEIKGVGLWTAQMILMFKLGRPDIFPAPDLGVQQGITRLYDAENWDKMRPLKNASAE
jgi:DNA-3-methyladenine glycosylase II